MTATYSNADTKSRLRGFAQLRWHSRSPAMVTDRAAA